ncbi:MAG TPA: 3-hydroxyacyl-CoA dehydrogenase family protein [Candidatus Limnocylindrales bacterium]|nr:3-hydroxyacyl-CoA dehydrogenase family protein [Candidatus Limnocylindrales bacterium]
MNVDQIKKICVVGAGNMGHQISLQAALCGFKVSCTDISEEQLAKAKKFTETYLPGRVAKGKLTEEQASRAQANLVFTRDLHEAAKDADFVIEAATEQLPLKRQLFKELDRICPPHTILATNSSFLISSLVADATTRPDKVCNMHFFNPALVMKCVEVVKGPHTSEETAQITMDLTKKLQKVPVLLHKEIYGFLVNRILAAINAEALFLYDTGVASFEDIDSAVVNALGHPMGPFRLQDLTGIDLAYHIMMGRYRESGNPEDKPSPTVVEKYVKGEWGEKTGKGFYNYK